MDNFLAALSVSVWVLSSFPGVLPNISFTDTEPFIVYTFSINIAAWLSPTGDGYENIFFLFHDESNTIISVKK